MTFLAAKNKLEAVVRLSNLTSSGPESLGPGSKERKSVFENLATGLQIDFSPSETKQLLAKLIAERLGATWDSTCESIGQTITLEGLNRLLKGAEAKLNNAESKYEILSSLTLQDEVNQISEIVVKETPLEMDGKECVQEMRDAEDSRWRQVQWQGFYFEMKMQYALTQRLGGGRKRFVNTEFDFVYKNIWDMKAHSIINLNGRASSQMVILNDSRAMDEAINYGGLGLIMLNGIPTYSRDFTRWHREFRGAGTGEPGRTLKSKFTSTEVNMFFIPTKERLEHAIAREEICLRPQGRNSNGRPRPDKYHLNLRVAKDSDLMVFAHQFN